MSVTPAAPCLQPHLWREAGKSRQWKTGEWNSQTNHFLRLEIPLGESPLIIYNHIEGGPWFVSSRLGYWILPNTITTAEEAIAEAVVALSQHLDWLRKELAAIPLTLPTTPAT